MKRSLRYYEEHAETMPRADIERVQERLVLQMVEHAYERSPLTRYTWEQSGIHPRQIRSLADYVSLAPFTDKDAVRHFRDAHHDPFGGMACYGAPTMKSVATTSGTTGDPTPLSQSKDYIDDSLFLRSWWEMGLRSGDYLSLMSFTFRNGSVGTRYASLGATPIFFSHDPRELPRLFKASLTYRPSVLMFLSNPMILMVEATAKKMGLDPKDIFSSYKAVVYGGEPIGSRQAELTKAWGIELFEVSALGEGIALECKEHNGLHYWEDFYLVEVLDPVTNEPVVDGQRGEMVITTLTDRLMPFVRYRTGDIVIRDSSPCGCGRTHGRIWVQGRAGDEMLVQGKIIMPRDLMSVIQQIPETTDGLFQIIRSAREMDILRLRVGYDPSLLKTSPDELMGRIGERVASAIGVPVKTELTHNAELLKLGPPHKIPRVSKS